MERGSFQEKETCWVNDLGLPKSAAELLFSLLSATPAVGKSADEVDMAQALVNIHIFADNCDNERHENIF